MHLEIIHPSEDDEFLTEERCHILELINTPDRRAYSIARARVEPNTTTAWHRLKDTEEVYYILQGSGEVERNESFTTVTKGDLVRIPKNVPQRIHNRGNEDLLFLCFCVPAFGAENYESLE